MALGLIAEAILRLEHKVDMLLRHFKVQPTQMHFFGLLCPVCNQLIDYQIDIMKCIVIRKCGCSTGKQPPAQPLLPVGEQNVPTKAGRRARIGDSGATDEEGAGDGPVPGRGGGR